MYKKCANCGKILPQSNFSKNGSSSDGYSYWCKECTAAHNKERRERAKRYIREYKKQHPCIVCGESLPGNLDFHHLDPSNKRYCVSDMIKMRSGVNVIQTEIDKCVVLCKNCHAMVHDGYINLDDYL